MTNGTNLGQVVNLPFGTEYIDNLNSINRAFDQFGGTIRVKDVTITTPPVSPSADDAYLIPTGSTPSGAWLGKAGNIAVWRPYITTGIENTAAPNYDFYPIKEGFTIYSIAQAASYLVLTNLSIQISAKSGIYTPTPSGSSNIASADFGSMVLYSCANGVVTVSGNTLLQAQGAGAFHIFATPPIATTFSDVGIVNGSGVALLAADTNSIKITGQGSTLIKFAGIAVDTNQNRFSYVYQYPINL